MVAVHSSTARLGWSKGSDPRRHDCGGEKTGVTGGATGVVGTGGEMCVRAGYHVHMQRSGPTLASLVGIQIKMLTWKVVGVNTTLGLGWLPYPPAVRDRSAAEQCASEVWRRQRSQKLGLAMCVSMLARATPEQGLVGRLHHGGGRNDNK
jgi:hypothetical protein